MIMPKTLVIHQTQYLPYVGLFAKLADADDFMFLDTVYYSTDAFINRNRVLTHDGVRWITVPVTLKDSLRTEICRLELAANSSWKRKHFSMLRNVYGRHPYFSDVYEIYREAVAGSDSFQDICAAIVIGFCEYLCLNVAFSRASQFGDYGAREPKIDRLVRLTAAAGCDVYVGGVGSLAYSTESDFAKFRGAGLTFEIRAYAPEPYAQHGWNGSFVRDLSIFDLLANMSPSDCVAYLKRTNTAIR